MFVTLHVNWVPGYSVIANTCTGERPTSNYGIEVMRGANNNTVVENLVSGVPYGISFQEAEDTAVIGNTIVNCEYGLGLYDWCSCTIYNNNFIDNTCQADVVDATGPSVFNQNRPVGGNYWSDWVPPEHADADCDGFVDQPYVLNGYQDDLP